MLKKIELAKEYYKYNEIFICPLCHEHLHLDDISLKCQNNHCFNISKKGVVTLLKNNKKRNDLVYDEILFNSRTKFINNGFYDGIHKEISSLIPNNSLIVDLGCGDGTHDFKIGKMINDSFIIGFDLAKDGINLSSNYLNYNFLPIIADLNYLPIGDNSIDVVLNILSPSNEKEIRRVLKKNGLIIKVTPKKNYLIELRKCFNIKEYENETTIEKNIDNNYDIVKKIEFEKTYKISKDDFDNLINMTPLTKHHNQNNIINEITIALNIFVLKVKDNE